VADPRGFESLLRERLAASELALVVARRPCILAAADIRKFEKLNAEKARAGCAGCGAADSEAVASELAEVAPGGRG
jgi:indolepyruvate ferredoxin oxidoreductase alpha subunit